MNSFATTVHDYHKRFQVGSLSAEELQVALSEVVKALPTNVAPVLRTALEQAHARMDFILWGVCEQERDAHIDELLRELEAKLVP